MSDLTILRLILYLKPVSVWEFFILATDVSEAYIEA